MRKIHIDKIMPGTINGKAIYTFSHKQRLLNRGMAIKPEYVKRLKDFGIHYVYVDDKISEGIELQEMIPDEIQLQAKECIANAMHVIKRDDNLNDTRSIAKSVNRIIDELAITRELIVNITDIRAKDDYTFGHSVSVCTLSIILGTALGLNDIQLRDLGIGALMHDVGKTKIPLEILNKPDKLTDEEMEIIKTHPQEGFEILRKCRTLNRNTVFVALGHHERYDGTGYPNGFKNNEIHLFSRIVSVVDTFDAMCADRVYRKGIETNKVIKYLELMSNKHFDEDIVKKFTEKIIMYPNGDSVILNTNEKAIVVRSNLHNPERPVVRICMDPNGQLCDTFREVDLSVETEYSIIGTCEDI